MADQPKKVVVMGGGTGTFPVICALKRLNLDISTVIAVSDSGGSTGRIRDEFGFQPVGDLRQSLAALAESEGEEWIRKLLLYRFSKGEGLKGHNLGNLILTALQDMTGDTTQALEIAEKAFRLEGAVIPVTKENVNLQINYQDGSQAVGEHLLDQKESDPKPIKNVSLTPRARLNPAAAQAIQEADLILIGPGDYYASIMAVLSVDGISQALSASHAQIVYIMNIMTRATQTKNMKASDHVKGVEAALQQPVDIILMNQETIPAAALAAYAAEQEFPVSDDLGADPRVMRRALISEDIIQQTDYDTAHRSLIRHDDRKLQTVLSQIIASLKVTAATNHVNDLVSM